MDSITQATLGAAIGHAVLGKRMGNKAILVGAIAGTIPDLDILSRLFLNHEVYGLVYHRGITHSIAFTVLAAPLFAWLSLKYYDRGWNKKLGVQVGLASGWGIFYLAILSALAFAAYYFQSLVLTGLFSLFALAGRPVYKSLESGINNRESVEYSATFKEWTLMFFLAFLTHWMIDACTAYGTQIFEPFSNYRVALNNISIVDPLYTVPMLIGLGIVIFAKNEKTKHLANYLGITIATLYMASTFYSKSTMNSVVTDSLAEQNIEYNEFITYPTLLNTILWQTTVESDDAYYYGTYSLWSKKPKIDFIKLPKNHDLIEKYRGQEHLDILLWFANGYYNLIEKPDGSIVFNNLRFGLMGLPKNSTVPIKDRYIFRFLLKEEHKKLNVATDRDFDRIKMSEMIPALWENIKGN